MIEIIRQIFKFFRIFKLSNVESEEDQLIASKVVLIVTVVIVVAVFITEFLGRFWS